MTQSNQPNNWTIYGKLSPFLTLVIILCSIYLTIIEYQLGTNGLHAIGTVKECRGAGGYFSWTPWIIWYKLDSKHIEGKVFNSIFADLEIGKKVAILYDPKEPQVFDLDNFWHRYFFKILGICLCTVYLGALPFTLRKSKVT